MARFLVLSLIVVFSSFGWAARPHIETHPTRSVIFSTGPSAALRAPNARYVSIAYNAELNQLKKDGFVPLTTDWGTRLYSDVRFLVKDDRLAPVFAEKYLSVLEREKLHLMQIYYLSDDEYNRLALMAFGVAAQESKLGRSLKYVLKENGQFAVTWLKEFQAWTKGEDYEGRNSRGPTQIKQVPELISRYYGIKEEQLNNPTLAAVATLGFLAQTYNEMLVRARNREKFHFITPDTIFDYTLYGYFGGVRRILRRAALPKDLDLNRLTDKQLDPLAIPEMNGYVLSVRNNIRWVTVLERSPRLNYDLRCLMISGNAGSRAAGCPQ